MVWLLGTAIGWVAFGLAALVALGNWGCVMADLRLCLRGSSGNISTIPFVCLALLCLAALAFGAASGHGASASWEFLLILIDPALPNPPSLLLWPLERLCKALSKNASEDSAALSEDGQQG